MGTFGGAEDIEPMSNWKWKQLLLLSGENEVEAIVLDAMKPLIASGEIRLNKVIRDGWNARVSAIENRNNEVDEVVAFLFKTFTHMQLRPILMKGQGIAPMYPVPRHRCSGDIDIYFGFDKTADTAEAWIKGYGKKFESDKFVITYDWNGVQVEHHRQMQSLMSRRLNKQLQRLVGGEIRCCDSKYEMIGGVKVEVVPPTLCLLMMLIQITRDIIDDGIRMKPLLDLGVFLRTRGDKVDFVKFQLWIESLKMERMAQVIGILLIEMFDFEKDEIPFVVNEDDNAADNVVREIIYGSAVSKRFRSRSTANMGTLKKETRSVYFHVRRCSKFMKCYPREIHGTIISRIAHSLDQVEE
jgi:hypothetical protein